MEPQGGTLTIETSVVRSSATEPAGRTGASDGDVRLTVRDTGCGMDAGTRSHVFEPFFTTKSSGPDAGLGLSTVYGIVRQHGGTISLESQPGRGSLFTIVFPPAQANRVIERPHDVTVSTRAPHARTIVVVEDQDDVRSLITLMLRRKGYSVIDAANGADAIRMIESEPGLVDLLIADVVMPGIGGRELYDVLSSRHPQMKVLFISGYNDPAFQTGGTPAAFLAKPFLLDTLSRKVREILETEPV
jgi:CheY-like chemotaxis protein